MEAIYLQSMTDFVLKIDGIVKQPEDQDIDDWSLSCFSVIENYAKFLTQPLQLGFFVTCIDDKPIEYCNMEKTGGKFCKVGSEIEKEAKERVLFKGFRLIANSNIPRTENGHCVILLEDIAKMKIEDLLQEWDALELTENAIKQFYNR